MVRILVVEDDDSVCLLAARALRRDGHDVDEAVDGAHGLKRIFDTDESYALVVSDVRMPEMDGLAMVRAAMDVEPGLRVLLATGLADQRELAPDLAGVVAGLLYKPYSLAELRSAVRKALVSPEPLQKSVMARRS